MAYQYAKETALVLSSALVRLTPIGGQSRALVGRVEEQVIAGTNFLAVHSPHIEGVDDLTVLVRPESVHSMHSVGSEDALDHWAYLNPAAEKRRLKEECQTMARMARSWAGDND